MEIFTGAVWKTRCGKRAEITNHDNGSDLPISATIIDGVRRINASYFPDGRFLNGRDHDYDLVSHVGPSIEAVEAMDEIEPTPEDGPWTPEDRSGPPTPITEKYSDEYYQENDAAILAATPEKKDETPEPTYPRIEAPELVRFAIEFMDRAAGEGISVEDLDPGETLTAYGETTGDEEFSTLGYRLSRLMSIARIGTPNPTPLEFVYRNWRGETATRRALPIRLEYGSNEWHPEPQWLLVGIDVVTHQERSFAMKDMVGGAMVAEPWTIEGALRRCAEAKAEKAEFELSRLKEDKVEIADLHPDYVEPGYEALASVLQRALDQAQTGKGKDRHATEQPFIDQRMMSIGRKVGAGFPIGQALKKTEEAVGMLDRVEEDKAVSEILGAINYLAAAVLLIREKQD